MPKVVAVIGASRDHRKFGNKAVRAFKKQGYKVVPINPNATSVEGLKCYSSVLDFPGGVDIATFYVPAEIGQKTLADVAEKDINEVWLNPGSDSPDLVNQAKTLGLRAVVSCSILGIGEDPSSY